jgi:hypothetical protein
MFAYLYAIKMESTKRKSPSPIQDTQWLEKSQKGQRAAAGASEFFGASVFTRTCGQNQAFEASHDTRFMG